MSEISGISANLSASQQAELKKSETPKNEESIFNEAAHDIGDIHGITPSHRYGNINKTKFDLECEQTTGNISGNINGKEVVIAGDKGLLKTTFKGSVGDTKVSIATNRALGNTKNYTGKYGDKSFDLKHEHLSDGWDGKDRIYGRFNENDFELTIDRNTFTADDIINYNKLPEGFEEFFPIISTIGRSSHF